MQFLRLIRRLDWSLVDMAFDMATHLLNKPFLFGKFTSINTLIGGNLSPVTPHLMRSLGSPWLARSPKLKKQGPSQVMTRCRLGGRHDSRKAPTPSRPLKFFAPSATRVITSEKGNRMSRPKNRNSTQKTGIKYGVPRIHDFQWI